MRPTGHITHVSSTSSNKLISKASILYYQQLWSTAKIQKFLSNIHNFIKFSIFLHWVWPFLCTNLNPLHQRMLQSSSLSLLEAKVVLEKKLKLQNILQTDSQIGRCMARQRDREMTDDQKGWHKFLAPVSWKLRISYASMPFTGMSIWSKCREARPIILSFSLLMSLPSFWILTQLNFKTNSISICWWIGSSWLASLKLIAIKPRYMH